jgi:hypothetical protein
VFLAASRGNADATRVLLEAGTKLTPEQFAELRSSISEQNTEILKLLDDGTVGPD